MTVKRDSKSLFYLPLLNVPWNDLDHKIIVVGPLRYRENSMIQNVTMAAYVKSNGSVWPTAQCENNNLNGHIIL